MNAKEELLIETKGKDILCISLRKGRDYGPPQKPYYLKTNHSTSQFEEFLKLIDFEYDDGYGSQELYGEIWYKDGTWSERHEYDGSESWVHKECPKIPEECQVRKDG